MASHRDVLQAVGPRLRALRLARHRTLADVSAATGISVSTLSRLESGLRRPTLELLLPLAETLQVHLDDLVNAPVTGDPRVHLKPLSAWGSTFIPLTRRPGGVQAYKQIIAPGWPTAPPEQSVHPGYEWLYVLSGQARLLLGDQDLTLSAGEVAEFDTNLPHFVGNPGPHPAEVLHLFGRQGERMHVRARPRRPRAHPW
ncbi:helix-turn-helix domain-containing protein [Cellulomonas cellasea]|uniref:helix-turn-helix domain-containing protein n=1 Tax=Cellulomonas cellasea TaxID=43670 RepID=UPI0025A486CE|nr:helix-turn-helix domain-containing protein [Cellulomonas cellasea]MDM8083306.1 helix-turn-helix domain-containing protein [Cellulomonas cellasea]